MCPLRGGPKRLLMAQSFAGPAGIGSAYWSVSIDHWPDTGSWNPWPKLHVVRPWMSEWKIELAIDLVIRLFITIMSPIFPKINGTDVFKVCTLSYVPHDLHTYILLQVVPYFCKYTLEICWDMFFMCDRSGLRISKLHRNPHQCQQSSRVENTRNCMQTRSVLV